MLKFDDYEWGLGRITRTYILHNGKLHYVEDGRGDTVSLYDKDHRIVNVKFRDLDLSPVSLGYVNYDDSCTFISRAPMRRDWKQGLRPSNITQKTFQPYEREKYFEGRDFFLIEDTVLGRYPTFEEALTDVEEVSDARAFCKYFSINEKGEIIYKGRNIVGKIKGEDKIELKNKFFYLKEGLDEVFRDESKVTISAN